MANNQEPLVESGMIEVALAITVLGFAIQQFEGITNNTYYTPGAVLFVVGGISTIILYTVYLYEWVIRCRQNAQSSGQKTRFRFALTGLILLYFVLIVLILPIYPIIISLF